MQRRHGCRILEPQNEHDVIKLLRSDSGRDDIKVALFPQRKTIAVVTDNITTTAYMNHLGGPSAEISKLESVT